MRYFSFGDKVTPVAGIEFPMGVVGAKVYHDTSRTEFVEGDGWTIVNEKYYEFWQGLSDPTIFVVKTDDPDTVTHVKLLMWSIPEYLQWQDDGGYAL